MKKILSLSLATAVISSIAVVSNAQTTGIYGVESHTKNEIVERYYELGLDKTVGISYEKEPDLVNFTTSGKISSETEQEALDTLNFVRYIAGLSDNITINNTYAQQAQDGSLVMSAEGEFSHTPSKPSKVNQTIYDSGYLGTSQGNISAGRYSLTSDIITGWMADSSSSNIKTLGHRRWILNPTMMETGFGVVKNSGAGGYASYSVMYSFDNAFTKTDIVGVVWPAQVMPIDYFGNDYPWSYSYGSVINGDVKVTLERTSDGKIWNFSSSSSNGDFYVNNDNYGKAGCVIFRPSSISYNVGDVFEVSISGALTASYTVEFIDFTRDVSSENTYPTVENASSWAQPELKEAVSLGYPVDLYPTAYGQDMTRAEFCYMIGKFLVSDESVLSKYTTTVFTDLGTDLELNKYINYLSSIGVIKGTSDTTFSPNDNVSREQMAVLMLRVEELKSSPTITNDITSFSDYSGISSWAVDGMRYANQIGIISGTGNNQISPANNTTIEQAALICYRYFSR